MPTEETPEQETQRLARELAEQFLQHVKDLAAVRFHTATAEQSLVGLLTAQLELWYAQGEKSGIAICRAAVEKLNEQR